jgi:hypothetical protein
MGILNHERGIREGAPHARCKHMQPMLKNRVMALMHQCPSQSLVNKMDNGCQATVPVHIGALLVTLFWTVSRAHMHARPAPRFPSSLLLLREVWCMLSALVLHLPT